MTRSEAARIPLPLVMSHQGIKDFAKLTKSLPRHPVVYAHVEMPNRRVLRIGKAERGIHQRWTTSNNGHLATFEWAMEWCDRYRPYAPKFPQYVRFFHCLQEMQTIVWTLVCDKSDVKHEERRQIKEYGPVWEEFRKKCKLHGVWPGKPRGQAVSRCDFKDPDLPTLDGLQSKKLWPL